MIESNSPIGLKAALVLMALALSLLFGGSVHAGLFDRFGASKNSPTDAREQEVSSGWVNWVETCNPLANGENVKYSVTSDIHSSYVRTAEIKDGPFIRYFRYYVPPNLDRSQPVPLVLELHGYGGGADFWIGLEHEAARAASSSHCPEIQENFRSVALHDLDPDAPANDNTTGKGFIVAWPVGFSHTDAEDQIEVNQLNTVQLESYYAYSDSRLNFGVNFESLFNSISGWNAGICCVPWNLIPVEPDPRKRTLVDDGEYVLKVVEHMKATYKIDDDRVYIAGHSNGAALVQRLILEASDVFAAAVAVSFPLTDSRVFPAKKGKISKIQKNTFGPVALPKQEGWGFGWRIPVEWKADYKPIPILNIHGYQDESIRYDGTILAGRYIAGVEESFRTWAELNQCSDGSSLVVDEDLWPRQGEYNAQHRVYANCFHEGGVDAVVEQIDFNGGHLLGLGSFNPTGEAFTTNDREMNLHKLMWDFLKNHTKGE